MTETVSKPCPICKTIITSTGGGGTVKHVQEKLDKHLDTHRPRPNPKKEARK